MGKINKRNISKVTSCWLWRLCLLGCRAWRSCLPVLGWNRQKCQGTLTPLWGSDEVMEADASSYSFFPLLALFWQAVSSAATFVANTSLHFPRCSWRFLGASVQNCLQPPQAKASPKCLQMWEQPEGVFWDNTPQKGQMTTCMWLLFPATLAP